MPNHITPKKVNMAGFERQQSYGPPELTGPFQPEDFPGKPDADSTPSAPAE